MKASEMWLLLTREERREIKRDIFRKLRTRGCIEGYIENGGTVVTNLNRLKYNG